MKKALFVLVLLLSNMVMAVPVRIPDGGTNNTSFTANLLLYFDGTKISSFPAGVLNNCVLYDATPKPTNGTCVLAVSVGTGLTLGGTSTNPSVSLTSPVSTANGGFGANESAANGYPKAASGVFSFVTL